MAHTNMVIYEKYDYYERQRMLEVAHANAKYWEAQFDHLMGLLENIPAAVNEYGFVDISYDRGRKTIKLVAQPASGGGAI